MVESLKQPDTQSHYPPVILEIILGQGDETKALTAICNLLKGAMQIGIEKAEAVVNFIQTERIINNS